MTDHEAKAREVVEPWAAFIDDAQLQAELVSEISAALREAEERGRLTEREACIEILHGLKPIATDPILDAAKGALDHGIRAIRLQPRAAAIRSRNDE